MTASNVVSPTGENLILAGRHIREGRLVAFPTETVYGLGGDACNDRALAAIFEAKGRPRFNPLIVHVASAAAAAEHVVLGRRAERLAERFWPGPLTLVLPRRQPSSVSLLASAGLDTLAVRMPDHEVALALLAEAGRPIAAPSANRSGTVSPTTAAHVAASLGERVAMILDGGPCPLGLESTVLDLSGSGPVLLRPGGVPREELEALIGPLGEGSAPPGDVAPAKAPGLVGRHYAPERPLRFDVGEDAAPAAPGEALLAFGPRPPAGFAAYENLSPSGDLREAAANLFAMLRALDRPGISAIAVMPVPRTGLGEAINDRLRRAAADRPVEAEPNRGQIG